MIGTTFSQETILFQNDFVITDDKQNRFSFIVPSLRDIFGDNNITLLRWIIGEKKESISALFFPQKPVYFKSKAAILMRIVSQDFLANNFKELLDGIDFYFHLTVEEGRLVSREGVPVSEEILNEMIRSFSISFNFEFKPIEDKNSSLEESKTEKFVPKSYPSNLDPFMVSMLIQEEEREWKKQQVRIKQEKEQSLLEKRKSEIEFNKKGFSTSPMYKIFISLIETYNLTLSEIQEFSLYKMYWYYAKVILIDQQKVLRIAQGNGMLGKNTKYAYYVSETGE